MPNNNNKINKSNYGEINTLDKVVNKNLSSLNDAQTNELKMTSTPLAEVQEPTPVSYFSLLKKTKNRIKTVHEGLSVLFDSGSSHSMILQSLVTQQKWKALSNPMGFESCNGCFDLSHKTDVTMIFPELNAHRTVTWQCFIDDRSGDDLGYDMIIGRDLMTALGIQIDFQEKKLKWDGAELEMRDFRSKKPTRKEIKTVLRAAQEPIMTMKETRRLVKILDSVYEKADLQEVVDSAKHINDLQKKMLYKLLKKYEEIFDGKLSKWKTEPVDFEFHEHAKPHNQRHFPVPHIHKETFCKELL